MPPVQGGTYSYLISDFVSEVQAKLANRQDVAARAPFWIRDALKDLTINYPFVELDEVGPVFQLTAGIRNYDIANFLNAATAGVTPQRYSMCKCFEVFVDYPTNSLTTEIRYKEPAVIMPLSRIKSLAKYWTRIGYQFYFGPCPDKGYSVQLTYQKEHPFNLPVTTASVDILTALNNSPVMLPDDWQEIVIYCAAEKGATELRLPDFVSMYHNLLRGDPADPSSIGIIKAKLSQHQRDKSTSPVALQPVVGRY